MAFGLPATVNPPETLEAFHGLIQTVGLVDEVTQAGPYGPFERWEAGFSFAPKNCCAPVVYNDCPVDDEGNWLPKEQKVPCGSPGCVHFSPYSVVQAIQCPVKGFLSRNYQQDALNQLELGLSKAIESEYWTGAIKGIASGIPTPNQSLVDMDLANILGGGTPQPPSKALGMLNQALADCGTGQLGNIHATVTTADQWCGLQCVAEDRSGRLRTRLRRNFVVAGAGYDGTGPIGGPPAPAGTAWAFATGLTAVRVGPRTVIPGEAELREAVNRSDNSVTYVAEASAAAVHDECCHFAVLVDLCCEGMC